VNSSHISKYESVWLVDAEYYSPVGEPVLAVHCICGYELKSGREIRLWRPQGHPCPYSIGPDSLIIAYAANAELACHRNLGWQLPWCIIDLYAEFRHLVCGIVHDDYCKLANAMHWFKLPFLDPVEKGRWQTLCASTPNLPEELREKVLDYCMTDVDAALRLLNAMMERIDYPRCLIRGRYSKAVMDIEQNGLPIDVPYFRKFESSWEQVRAGLIHRQGHGLFVNTELDRKKFECFLARLGILDNWPRTPTGMLTTDDSVLGDVAGVHPILGDIYDLRRTFQSCKTLGLPIGADGRARCAVRPYRTTTGRNNSKSSEFILGRSAWFRHFIKFGVEEAGANLDYVAQEFAIAGALSGDETMLHAYLSGDPYMGTAIAAHLAPAGATPQSHPKERAMMKPVVLGMLYGQEAWGIARRTGMTEADAFDLLRRIKKAFPKFFAWREQIILTASLHGFQTTRLGWRVYLPDGRVPNERSLSNHPVQGTAADILRVASILSVERGVSLGALVHDSMVIVGGAESIRESIEIGRAAMVEAGKQILGIDLRVSLGGMLADDQPDNPVLQSPILPGGRYFDQDGYPSWKFIRSICPPDPENRQTMDSENNRRFALNNGKFK